MDKEQEFRRVIEHAIYSTDFVLNVFTKTNTYQYEGHALLSTEEWLIDEIEEARQTLIDFLEE
jgi:hypothetical protein